MPRTVCSWISASMGCFDTECASNRSRRDGDYGSASQSPCAGEARIWKALRHNRAHQSVFCAFFCWRLRRPRTISVVKVVYWLCYPHIIFGSISDGFLGKEKLKDAWLIMWFCVKYPIFIFHVILYINNTQMQTRATAFNFSVEIARQAWHLGWEMP